MSDNKESLNNFSKCVICGQSDNAAQIPFILELYFAAVGKPSLGTLRCIWDTKITHFEVSALAHCSVASGFKISSLLATRMWKKPVITTILS